jgi:outer membrane translocation and assembly module TamA
MKAIGFLFTDMGALSQNGLAEIKRKDLLGASGFGLRYDTSVGSLRFDIGWKWKKRFPNDSSFVWFLTLGQAF